MKQVTQKLRDGRTGVVETPPPLVSPGTLLVRNAFSVISAGTEGSTIRAARQSLVGKARARPQQAKLLLELVTQAGPVQAYRTLQKKLDSYSPLGYSSAGVVLAVGRDVTGFAPGDKVACGGTFANHAEFVAVAPRLCVKLPPDADLQVAAYNTLGAIALQGIRQADLRLGEVCAVIGLGLLGQLACVLLRAAGVRVVGIDVNAAMVNLAREKAADLAALRSDPGLAERISQFTGGIGVDAVIITAASDDTDPVNFAGRILRGKGKVVIVGQVPTGFDRDPHYYRKELDLRMSCSYGPGRYDSQYEEAGIDYPAAYVRWTEQRNMEAFQAMLHSGRVDIRHLTTHVFPLEQAVQAYDLIMDRTEPHVGIVLKYNERPGSDARIAVTTPSPAIVRGQLSIAFVGAGSYATGYLLPHIPRDSSIRRRSVMTASGLSARTAAERFGFEVCTSDESDVFDDPAVDAIFVATRHNTHAGYVEKALAAGKAVFVEKPLCTTETELTSIAQLVATASAGARLTVGFNRRFSPLVTVIRETFGAGRLSMLYRVNAGAVTPDSWIQDRRSGGRIVGEVCHFIDLLTFLNGSPPVTVQAFALPAAGGHEDTATINLTFQNGSIGAISYFANGPKSLPKEYLEVYGGGTAAVLRDFKDVEIFSSARTRRKRLMFQDKGQAAMVRAFLDSVRSGSPPPIAFDDIAAVTAATFSAVESLRSGAVLTLAPAGEASAQP